MEGEVSRNQDEALGLHLGPLRWCHCGTVTGIRSSQNTDEVAVCVLGPVGLVGLCVSLVGEGRQRGGER